MRALRVLLLVPLLVALPGCASPGATSVPTAAPAAAAPHVVHLEADGAWDAQADAHSLVGTGDPLVAFPDRILGGNITVTYQDAGATAPQVLHIYAKTGEVWSHALGASPSRIDLAPDDLDKVAKGQYLNVDPDGGAAAQVSFHVAADLTVP